MAFRQHLPYCGCWHTVPDHYDYLEKHYLPQVDLKAHTTVLSSTSRTTLTQTFLNPAPADINEVKYTFPLFDGVSVVAFEAKIGDRTITGVVKEREQAKKEYDEAVQVGRQAALLEQSMSASDTFTTSIGNVPSLSKAVVHITYLGELQHDAQVDGLRLTFPSVIAPRYGTGPAITKNALTPDLVHVVEHGKIDATVDVEMGKESKITTIQSPSHPVTVTLGRASVNAEEVFESNLANAAYVGNAGNVFFEKDFVIIVKASGQDVPSAMLETHPTIPSQRAIMASLVPKFNIPTGNPEIVFVVDCSGSMYDKMDTLRAALLVFLKSLPVGVKFNICSFGSSYTFMWSKSRTYDADSLNHAMSYVNSMSSNMGGTEMYNPLNATVQNRVKGVELEVLMLTDGEVWDQEGLFKLVNDAAADNDVRFFTLGIGDQASHSLINGIARAGDGFAQSVGTNEQLDRKVVRMLKGALTPHIHDYTFEVEYDEADDEYDIIEKTNDIPVALAVRPKADAPKVDDESSKKPISLFSSDYKEAELPSSVDADADLPELAPPNILQAPYKVPSLFSFNRTSVYLLLSPETNPRAPKSVTLRGTSKHGPLQLTIQIEDVGKGTTIHQLAARKAMLELEEGRGWVYHARDSDGNIVVDQHESKKQDLVKREAVRLGLKFQVGGKWCSFVAVEDGNEDPRMVALEEAARATHRRLQAACASAPQARTISMSMGKKRRTSGQRRQNDNRGQLAAAPATFAHQAPPPPRPSGDPLFFSIATDISNGGSYSISSFGASSVGAAGPTMSRGGPGMNASTGVSFGAPEVRAMNGPSMLSMQSPIQCRGLPRGWEEKLRQERQEPCGDVDMLMSLDSPSPTDIDSTQLAQYNQFFETEMEGGETELVGGDTKTRENKVHALIALQQFEGSWEYTESLLGIMGIKTTDVEGVDWAVILGTTSLVNNQDELTRKVVATLLVGYYLDTVCAGQRETWDLVYDKAFGWADAAVTRLGGDVSKRNLQPFLCLFA